ncbi:HSP20 family protein [Catalinimonas alkaloidigena]|uniref:HSP20 family protein n=1 Tax=Catalinimonas alkaloidigena TaxID=1075417 RepID=A0A1G8WQQ3_9BACT|nr:Hsp20/alpha crystallin family protein [Catalinimonas alkaloidigena]SDJ80624.1 HSP20 family protein [Catalinimonas alkaloidigena]
MYRKHYGAGSGSDFGPAWKRGSYEHFNKFWKGMQQNFYRRPKYNIPLNIVEKDTFYEVYVYAVTFSKENISISVVDDVLYISGTRTVDEGNLPNFSRQEYPIKSFERMLNLNGQVDPTDIKARQEDGVLIITLPKSPEAQKPEQKITID